MRVGLQYLLPSFSDYMVQQPGYLSSFPARNWIRTSAVLDGTIPHEDICHWVDVRHVIRLPLAFPAEADRGNDDGALRTTIMRTEGNHAA